MSDDKFGDQYLDWVSRHAADDPDRLRLAYHGDPRPWLPLAITQVAAMRRAGKKFSTSAGESFMPRVIASDIALQQSTSADIALLHASILARHIPLNATVLDMTCGLGIDSLALSRLFRVTACELNPLHAAMARENFRGNANVTIVETDSVKYLAADTTRRFDAVFIDPARRDSIGRRVYSISDCVPDLTAIWTMLKSAARVIMCKLSPMLDISRTLVELPGLTELHVIGDGRECKELVALCDNSHSIVDPREVPVSLWTSPQTCDLSFTIAREAAAQTMPNAVPAIGDKLFIPGPVAMKAGCFSTLSSVYHVNPLAPNTHLYVSKTHDAVDFPVGHAERVTDIIPWKSSELKKLKKQKLKASVRVRNFGMTASQLSEKLSLQPGSDETMITGVTLSDKSRVILLTTRR